MQYDMNTSIAIRRHIEKGIYRMTFAKKYPLIYVNILRQITHYFYKKKTLANVCFSDDFRGIYIHVLIEAMTILYFLLYCMSSKSFP